MSDGKDSTVMQVNTILSALSCIVCVTNFAVLFAVVFINKPFSPFAALLMLV